MGTIDLDRPPDDPLQRMQGEALEAKVFVIQCDWPGHVHVPIWATPAMFAFIFVGCPLACSPLHPLTSPYRRLIPLRSPYRRRTSPYIPLQAPYTPLHPLTGGLPARLLPPAEGAVAQQQQRQHHQAAAQGKGERLR